MADDSLATRLEKSYELTVAGERFAGESRQVKGAVDPAATSKYIDPPLPPEQLVHLSAVSAVRASVIDAIARNTVGLGYSVEIAEGHEMEDNDPREEAWELERKLEACAARDDVLDNPSLTELLLAVKTDEEETGNGYLEVSRNRLSGKIDGLFHLPAARMRRRKDRKGWALLREDSFEDEEATFYNFGDKVVYTSDGQPSRVLKRNRIWFTNEVIRFRLYNSESRDYGLPRDVALALEYAGDKLASEYNVSFFDSGGTPPTVLFVHGEPDPDGQGRVTFRVPQRTVERIAQTIKSDGDHRDRVAIIPLPAGSKTEMHQLGQVSDKDMGFVNFRADVRQRALSAFRVSPVFIAVEGDGRYDAEVQRAITLEQVFDPEQDRYESRLTRTVINDLGYPHLTMKFKRLAVENDKARRESASRLAEAAAITRRELRDAHGRGPLPEAQESGEVERGQVPFGWNDEIVNMKQPEGAENRTYDEQDQRGLRPGLAGREQQSTDNELEIAQERQRSGEVQKAMREEFQSTLDKIIAMRPEMPELPPINIEVPITVEKSSGHKRIVADEFGVIQEIVPVEDNG